MTLYNKNNFLVALSPNDKEILLQDVNGKKVGSIDPWRITFTYVNLNTIVVKTTATDNLVMLKFATNSEATEALKLLQSSINALKLVNPDISSSVNDFVITTINNALLNNSYHHIQSAPSTLWTINHNKFRRTKVSIMDNSSNEIVGLVTYISDNTYTIEFNTPISGHSWI